jgi:hypothetical protein
MKMKWTRWGAGLLFGCTLVLLFAGCDSKRTDASSSQPPPDSSQSTAPRDSERGQGMTPNPSDKSVDQPNNDEQHKPGGAG